MNYKKRQKALAEMGTGRRPGASKGGKARPNGSRRHKTKQKSASEGFNIDVQRLAAMIGFGLCGLLVGFLTGANQLPPLPAAVLGCSLAKAGWIGASVGTQVLNIGFGLSGGFLGAVVGTGLGFSLFLPPAPMVMLWASGSVLLGIVMYLSGSPALAALGWLVGCTPVVLQELTGSPGAAPSLAGADWVTRCRPLS